MLKDLQTQKEQILKKIKNKMPRVSKGFDLTYHSIYQSNLMHNEKDSEEMLDY